MTEFEYILDPPNEREYSSTNLGTWSSISDVDTFLNRFNHGTNYKDGNTKLSVGNYVTIQDGSTYTHKWVIAGFDMEHNQTAADGTVYDNGYGICMIQQSTALSGDTRKWGDSITGGYIASNAHTVEMPNIVTYLKTVLGSHLINRNVLLSSSVDSNGYSNAYTWTTSYATLMSVGQLTGTFASNRNKYDDGEANYKLPIFNTLDYTTYPNLIGYLRNIYGVSKNDSAYSVDSGGIKSLWIRTYTKMNPLIYLR